jgi:hypothetical protein
MNMRAWYFLYEGNKMRDGNVAPDDGVTLKYDGKIAMCSAGYHASLKPHQALQYAPGPILCLVELGGEIIQGDDKVVASERTIICRMDATEMLRYYARMQALKATMYWEPPQVVLDYLMTGDESIMDAARDAARAAARDAARAAARDAAWDAARDAAWAEFDELVFECFEGPLKEKP